MKKLMLLFVIVVASCGPSKEKVEQDERAELKRNMRQSDSTICANLHLKDTALYK